MLSSRRSGMAVVAVLFCLALPPVRAAAPFDLESATLPAALAQIQIVTGKRCVIALTPGHPARKRRVSLTMTVDEPEDLLTAVACAFGLRWLAGQHPGEVRFVDKADYRGTAAGLRQAVSDALPANLMGAVIPGAGPPLSRLTASLLQLKRENGDRLIALTADGPRPIENLDPAIALSMLRFLDVDVAARLGLACDQAAAEWQANPKTQVHYGINESGTMQFSFTLGNRFTAVDPN